MTEPRRVIIEPDYGAGGIWLVTTKEEREAHPREGPATLLPQSDVPPTRMQLTPGLRDDLKAWNQAWDDSVEGFWGDVEAWHASEVQGRELAIRVQEELGTDGWEVLYHMTGRVHRVHPPGSWPAKTWEHDVLGYTRHPHPRQSISALRREEEDRFLERLREYEQETGEDSSPPWPRRAVVYADYAQFYLQDVQAFAAWMKAGGAADTDVPLGGWTDEAIQVSRIGIEPHSISVGTARRDFVETSLQLLPQAPVELAEDAEHIVEADLDVISGAVSLYGCTEQPGPGHETKVPAGRYRVRVSYLPSERPARSHDDEPGTFFLYRLDMWPANEAAAVAVLKQGPSPWAM